MYVRQRYPVSFLFFHALHFRLYDSTSIQQWRGKKSGGAEEKVKGKTKIGGANSHLFAPGVHLSAEGTSFQFFLIIITQHSLNIADTCLWLSPLQLIHVMLTFWIDIICSFRKSQLFQTRCLIFSQDLHFCWQIECITRCKFMDKGYLRNQQRLVPHEHDDSTAF